MKKTILLLALFACTSVMYAQQHPMVRFSVIIGQDRPTATETRILKGEESKHPAIVSAINQLNSAISSLRNAPDDFGGHKQDAIDAAQKAVVSLRKALYYHVYAEGK